MARDKVIRVRASDYDKAVLKALADKLNDVYTLSTPMVDSDVVRLGIDTLVKQYLNLEEVRELKRKYG